MHTFKWRVENSRRVMHAKQSAVCKAFFSLIPANALTNVHQYALACERINAEIQMSFTREWGQQQGKPFLSRSECRNHFRQEKNRHSSHAGDTTTPSVCLPMRRWFGCWCSCQYYTNHMPSHNTNNNDINCNNNNTKRIFRLNGMGAHKMKLYVYILIKVVLVSINSHVHCAANIHYRVSVCCECVKLCAIHFFVFLSPSLLLLLPLR